MLKEKKYKKFAVPTDSRYIDSTIRRLKITLRSVIMKT